VGQGLFWAQLRQSFGNISKLRSFEQHYDHGGKTDTLEPTVPGTAHWDLRQRAELVSRHYWDAKRRWKNTTKLASITAATMARILRLLPLQRFRTDSVSRRKPGELKATATLLRYDYPVQIANATDTAKWYKTGLC